MNRQLAHAARPGDGFLAARVVVAEQHIGERAAAFDAGKKCMYECAGLFDERRHGERAAGDEHHDHRLAGGDERIDESLLLAGQIEMRAVFCFPALGFAFAHHGDDEVAIAGFADGGGDALRVAIDRVAFCVELRAFRIT